MKSVMKSMFVACIALAAHTQVFAERSFNYYEENRTFTSGYTPNDVAACTTLTTNAPLPTYVCCADPHYKDVAYKDTTSPSIHWVSGSCGDAVKTIGCDINTPVNTTGAPILGNCQFSSLKADRGFFIR